MTPILQNLLDRLKGIEDLKTSVVEFVKGVAEELNNLTHDPVAIGVMAAHLKNNAEPFGEAIVANTDPKTEAKSAVPEPDQSHPTTKGKAHKHGH